MATLGALIVFAASIVAACGMGLWLGAFAWRNQRIFQRQTTRTDPVARVFFPGEYTSPFPWQRRPVVHASRRQAS